MKNSIALILLNIINNIIWSVGWVHNRGWACRGDNRESPNFFSFQFIRVVSELLFVLFLVVLVPFLLVLVFVLLSIMTLCKMCVTFLVFYCLPLVKNFYKKKKITFIRQISPISFFSLAKKRFFGVKGSCRSFFLPVRCFSKGSDESKSKEEILKGKSLLWKCGFYIGYYYERRRIKRRHKKSLLTKFRKFLAWLGYIENPSYRLFVWKPSKKENENIMAQVYQEAQHFRWWMVQEMKDFREEGLIAPTGDLLAATSEAIRNVEWAIHEEKRRQMLAYRKYLRQEGYSEEKIKEMTTAYMPDGKPYELSDSETVSRRLTPQQIQERDKMRYILSVYEEMETLVAVAIRNEALQEDEQFDPINFPPVPVWRYNPAVWNNPYASWESIENEFLTRYYDLDQSRARRESQAVACWGWYWGALLFFGFFIQGLNIVYGPYAESDWDGFMLNNFLHPIEDHLTHFDWIIPTPHRMWGYFGEGRWWIPYYKHFLWPEPYYHEMWDTQMPEALHPLDGVLYTPLGNKNGTWIIVHDYSMIYPASPVAGDEGLFTYDTGLPFLDMQNCGSGGLAETIWSSVSYGPWFDDFSGLDFDPCVEQPYPVVKVLWPKVLDLHALYMKWYTQSWYRKCVLFFARHFHMWMWERPTADHLFWFDHLVIFCFWWPLTIYFTWSNARAWVVDWEVFKLYWGLLWKEARTGFWHDDWDIDMTWDEWYFQENVRFRVLYMHTDWGFHMYRPFFPEILREGSIFPTDYENNPDFNGAEVGVFIQMLGVHFDDYERILANVYMEQGAVYQKWYDKFTTENASLIAYMEKKHQAQMEDDAFIAAMRAENPYVAANFLAERRYARYRASMTFVFREINISEEMRVEPGWLWFKDVVAKHTVNPKWVTFVERF